MAVTKRSTARLGDQVMEKCTIGLWRPGSRPAARCYVYEIWDVLNRLVYVGVADNFERRWRQHVANSWWFGEIEVDQIHVSGYRSRSEARQVEASIINEQAAVYNTERESRFYRLYRGLYEDPARPIDNWDCVPVDRVIYSRIRNG